MPVRCRQRRCHRTAPQRRPAAQALAGRRPKSGEYRHHQPGCAHRIREPGLYPQHRVLPGRSHRRQPARAAVGQHTPGHLPGYVGHADPGPGLARRTLQRAQGWQRICGARHHRPGSAARWEGDALPGDQGGRDREKTHGRRARCLPQQPGAAGGGAHRRTRRRGARAERAVRLGRCGHRAGQGQDHCALQSPHGSHVWLCLW